MTNEPALTVDSLYTFSYKKKRFSFSNKNLSKNDELHNKLKDENEDQSDDSSNKSDSLISPTKKVNQPKGTAKLKHSSSDEENSSSTNSDVIKKK